ncbi:MAG: hypothetical protein AB1725_08605 [Armatimonadota bacterium]
MSCKLYLVYDPEQDVHLRDQVVRWCESSDGACEVADWTPLCEYGAIEQQMTQAAMRACDAVVVLVGRDTPNAPNALVEIEIARKLRLPLFQLVSPEAIRRFMPGAGPAIPWSLQGLIEQLATI